jgi:cell division protease FtsH
VFHDPTSGASNDIEKATGTAKRMVTEFGMSALIGSVKLGAASGEMFLGRDMGHSRDYSDELAEQVDKEVRTLIESAHDEAYQLILENRATLDRLATALLEKETLDQHELAEIFKDLTKLPPRPQWLSSDRRPVSDLPAVSVPHAKAPIDAGAVDGGIDSDGGSAPVRKRSPRIKPRPATA